MRTVGQKLPPENVPENGRSLELTPPDLLAGRAPIHSTGVRRIGVVILIAVIPSDKTS